MIYLCVTPEGDFELWYKSSVMLGWHVRNGSPYIEYYNFGPEVRRREIIEQWQE